MSEFGRSLPARLFCLAAAVVLSAPALLLPYRARCLYLNAIGFLTHLPYLLFGRIAHYLVKRLDLRLEGG